MRDIVLFDLDGTLTDPMLGITNSVMHAMEKFGLPIPPRKELYKFIGPPLMDSFQEFCGFTPDEARLAIVYYREHFSVDGMFENSVYEGIPELLQVLKAAGRRLIVATSKPEEFSVKILDHFGLLPYFELVAGSTMDERRTGKAAVIAYALESCGSPAPDRLIMVGDREHDVIGAHENGLPCVGVLYGYGSEAELRAAGAEYIAESCEALKALLLSL